MKPDPPCCAITASARAWAINTERRDFAAALFDDKNVYTSAKSSNNIILTGREINRILPPTPPPPTPPSTGLASTRTCTAVVKDIYPLIYTAEDQYSIKIRIWTISDKSNRSRPKQEHGILEILIKKEKENPVISVQKTRRILILPTATMKR